MLIPNTIWKKATLNCINDFQNIARLHVLECAKKIQEILNLTHTYSQTCPVASASLTLSLGNNIITSLFFVDNLILTRGTEWGLLSSCTIYNIEDISSAAERGKRKEAFSFDLFCKLLTLQGFIFCSLFKNCVRNYRATTKHAGQRPGSLENCQRQLLSQSSYSLRNGSQQKDTKFLTQTGTWC